MDGGIVIPPVGTPAKKSRSRKKPANPAEPPKEPFAPLYAHRVIAMNVFDFDGRVIDQHSNRQRESTQSHDVEGLTGDLQKDDRGQDRQGYRSDHDQHAARRTNEDQNHQRDQHRGRIDDRADHSPRIDVACDQAAGVGRRERRALQAAAADAWAAGTLAALSQLWGQAERRQ